jgi:hypothetical protein
VLLNEVLKLQIEPDEAKNVKDFKVAALLRQLQALCTWT